MKNFNLAKEIKRMNITEQPAPLNFRFKDLTGQRFGKLKAVKYVGVNKYNNSCWLCECDCGNKTIKLVHNMTSGQTKSCGCSRKNPAKSNLKHGLSHSHLYHTYSNIRQMCMNPKNPRYNKYGGKGITMCDEWLKDRNVFFEWSFKNGYDSNNASKIILSRKDTTKEFSPENCEWILMDEMIFKSKNGILITYGEYTYRISQWAKIIGISRRTLYGRLFNLKWSIEKSLTTNVDGTIHEIVIPDDMLKYNMYSK